MDSITQFSRTSALIGVSGTEKLNNSSVLLFGLGGVGGYVAEGIARAGIGRIGLCDGDTVSITNLNRQIIALHSTIGMNKAECAAERIRDINPDCKIDIYPFFYTSENSDSIDFSQYDYIADAIDSVGSKILIIKKAKSENRGIISCMGTGNKLVSNFEITDIFKTSVCPLARVMRTELKKRGVTGVKVVYSKDEPYKTDLGRTPASISYVPASAGLLIAGEIIRDLLK